jgi:uncharacterized membrane protein
MIFKESVTRSLVKAIGFRVVGFIMVLSLLKLGSENDIALTFQLNISALILYIIYERIWNYINWGRDTQIPK